jgi:UDP-N-acetylglucosamine 2-epimerase (non-hydrolysing)
MQTREAGRIAVLFGTRPEAIKLAPVILALQARGRAPLVVTTGQHRELVDDVLERFGIDVDEDLDLMRPDQTLDYLLARAIEGVGRVLGRRPPRAVVVQGDTTSTLGAALAAFHRQIPLAHVEAGLRSNDIHRPFPEEVNRRTTTLIARWHFAPTEMAAENLRTEGVTDGVFVTGNTVVDALRHITSQPLPLPPDVERFVAGVPFILATAHRRESWGTAIGEVAAGLADVLDADPTLRLVFVTHPNSAAREPVVRALSGQRRALVVDALAYPSFIGLLRDATVVVTDSGGLQEEGPTLGVPVLVTRGVTERPEGVAAGAVELLGTHRDEVRQRVLALTADPAARDAMARAGRLVYGDGRAAERIADVLVDEVD